MSLLKESVGIFRRNPFASAATVLLILTVSLAQVVSLGSLYPILQILVSDPDKAFTENVFAKALRSVGVASTLEHLLGLFVLVGISYSILNWSAEAFQARHLRNFETAVRRELFESVVMADWTYGRTLKHGEFLNVISREAYQCKYVVRYALYAFSSFLQFGALLTYAVYLNWPITLLGLSLFGVGSLFLIPIIKAANELGHASTRLANQMSNRVVAALRALKTVKALSMEASLARTLQPAFVQSATNDYHQGLLASGQYSIMETIAFLAISSMLYIGLTFLQVPKADLFVILVVLFRALPQVRLAIDNYQRACAYLPSLDIVRHHLKAARSAKTRIGGVKVHSDWQNLKLRDVTFTYEGGGTVIKNLSLKIARGQFFGIVGPSGSGKTTLLDLLLGLLQPQTGDVTVDEIVLAGADLQSWHEQISYVGQEAFVFSGTLRENLLWGTNVHFADSDLIAALRAAHLETLDSHAPLDKEIAENGSNLSGGEKQRLALARLFLRRPTLLILDEPTTGLDAVTERDIMESILRHFTETTFIIVTHREELTRNAHQIVRLSSGGIDVETNRITDPVLARPASPDHHPPKKKEPL